MIQMGKKKDVLTQILGAEDEVAEESGDALLPVCQELIDAIKADDVEGVASALKAAYAHCGAEPGGE